MCSLILFRRTAYSVDVSESSYGRVVKLAIMDRHDGYGIQSLRHEPG